MHATPNLQPASPDRPRVVCVDLDGTLISGDLFWESFLELLKRRPWLAFVAIGPLLRGKAHLKRFVASRIAIEPARLPFREEVLTELQTLRRNGASLVLATAADEIHARAVAQHLGIFDEVIASDGVTNLSGRRKAAALCERYGQRCFDYFGNDWADVPVWRVADRAGAVCAAPRLVRRVSAQRQIDQVGQPRPHAIKALARAMRPYQWVKNVLVFTPLVASHKFVRLDLVLPTTFTFMAFCCCASAIYLLNDIFDVPADRQHPRKRRRAFAAGHLSITMGLGVSIALLAAGLALAFFGASPLVAAIAVGYIAATTLYSVHLKRKPVADVFMLTGLYVLRVFAGGAASDTTPSSWLLGFALFFFLSLAWLKRYAEVATTEGWLAGRGYRHEDATWMQAIGTSAGYMAIVVLALYLTAPDVAVLYSRPRLLWLLCPLLLFWLTRMWLRAGRGLVHDDPVVEALRDPPGYAVLAAAAVITFAAA